MSGQSKQKVFVPPINLIFKYLQQESLVSVWLYEQVGFRIEGKIKGFDEFMNVVLEEAVEVTGDERAELGRILLKGDNITLITSLDV